MDSSERQRSVSAEGRAKGDPAETEVGWCVCGVVSNGFGMGPEGVEGIVRRAKKVIPAESFSGQVEFQDNQDTNDKGRRGLETTYRRAAIHLALFLSLRAREVSKPVCPSQLTAQLSKY
jgi:hypothetical protein